MNALAVAEVVRNLEAAGAEMRACAAQGDDIKRRAQRAHEAHIRSEFKSNSYGETGTYNRREQWHQLDMQRGTGIFLEAINESVYDAPELYQLMLADPAAFGIELAKRFHTYADKVARQVSY